MDRHERPYKCTVDNCHYQQEGFTAKADLSRHETTVHKLHHGKEFFCDEPGCAYGPARKDNLKDHMRRIHGRPPAPLSHVPEMVEPDNASALPDPSLELLQHRDRAPVTPLRRKRRRISDKDLANQTADGDEVEEINFLHEPKRMTHVGQSPRNELMRVTQELKEEQEKHKETAERLRRMRQQVQELEKTREKHEERAERYLGIIERLTRQQSSEKA